MKNIFLFLKMLSLWLLKPNDFVVKKPLLIHNHQGCSQKTKTKKHTTSCSTKEYPVCLTSTTLGKCFSTSNKLLGIPGALQWEFGVTKEYPRFVTGWWVIPCYSPAFSSSTGKSSDYLWWLTPKNLQKTSTCFHEVHLIFGEPAWLKPCFSQQIFGATFWARTWIRPGEVVAATQKTHPQRCGWLFHHRKYGDSSW